MLAIADPESQSNGERKLSPKASGLLRLLESTVPLLEGGPPHVRTDSDGGHGKRPSDDQFCEAIPPQHIVCPETRASLCLCAMSSKTTNAETEFHPPLTEVENQTPLLPCAARP